MTDFSNEAYIIQCAIASCAATISEKLTAPHVLLKPSIFPDGDQWCALMGEDIAIGICGFGDTPEEACHEFDKAFRTSKTPFAYTGAA